MTAANAIRVPPPRRLSTLRIEENAVVFIDTRHHVFPAPLTCHAKNAQRPTCPCAKTLFRPMQPKIRNRNASPRSLTFPTCVRRESQTRDKETTWSRTPSATRGYSRIHATTAARGISVLLVASFNYSPARLAGRTMNILVYATA